MVHVRFRSVSTLTALSVLLGSLSIVPAQPRESRVTSEPAGVTADQRLAEARAHASREAVEEALEAYEDAVRLAPERLDAALEYAGFLRRWGFWLRGAAQYRRVLTRHPDHVEALLGYGDLLLAQYQFGTALEVFGRVLAADPPVDVHSWERAMLGYGSALYGGEDLEGAAATFEALIARSPGVLPAYAFLATTRRDMGDLDGAGTTWNRLMELAPDATRANARRREVEDLRSEIRDARATVQANPQDMRAWMMLGERLEAVPDPAEAVKAYEGAVALRPDDANARYRLGVALRDAGRFAAAAPHFRRIVEDPVRGQAAAYNLSYCARRAGLTVEEAAGWAKAVERVPIDLYAYGRYIEVLQREGRLEVERALVAEQVRILSRETGPRDPMPWVRLAMIDHADGRVGEARRTAIAALAVDMNHVHVRRTIRTLFALDNASVEEMLKELASVPSLSGAGPSRAVRGAFLLALGRAAEAEPDLRMAREQGREEDANRAALTVALGSCLRETGNLAEALGMLERAAETWPRYIWAHLDLALARLAAGRDAEAAAASREAMRLQPDSPIPYALLGVALRQSGDLRGAAAALERALALDPLNVTASSRLLLVRVYGALDLPDRGRGALVSDLPREPREIYHAAWEFVRDTYHDRTFNGQDWAAWERRFDGRLTTTADALGAVGLMLSSLDDRNTRLRTPDKTINLLFTPRRHEAQFLDSGAAERSSRTVEARRLEDNVGYIAITNLDDPKAPRAIQEAVETLSSADGIILDLRGNQGGSDADVPQIAGMFVPEGVSTGKLVGPQGTVEKRAEAPPGRSAPIIPADKPVVVLVDRNTGSSAESLAGSLRESGRAVLVGERTFGKAGVQLPLLLVDGTIVLVVAAEHADRQGRVYTGKGLDPDHHLDAPIRGGEGDDAAVGKAREVLRRSRERP